MTEHAENMKKYVEYMKKYKKYEGIGLSPTMLNLGRGKIPRSSPSIIIGSGALETTYDGKIVRGTES